MDNLLSLAKLEQIANIACFSLNYQEKLEAERYFLEIAKNLSTSLLLEILRNGSDTLIFVTIEYANKLVEEYSIQFLKELFNVVETEACSWYVPDSHEFRRRDTNIPNGSILNGGINQLIPNQSLQKGKQITKYVMNSIAFFMSNCMKRFFQQDSFEKRQQIVQWICNKPNERYKLWLFTIFIQNISQIDQSMGFIKFRSLSYNFQQEVIPIISKCLIPFLFRVEDIMKVNEISNLQEQLNVGDQTSLTSLMQKQQKIFQNENQFKFAKLVFELLHHLVFYNFHLTYTEYEQESSFDNCLICFPQEFTAKVVNEEFIGSIGYVIERLIDIMPQSIFLKTTLECLQKIFLTKLSYVDEKIKLSFINECTIMLTKCLNRPNLDRFILTKLMVCNNKFLNNVEINYLKDKPQLKASFHQWLLTITKTTFMVLDNLQLSEQFNFNLQESLIIECLQLYQKIVGAMCSISYTSFEQPNENSQERQFIENNVKGMTQTLVKKLLVDQLRPLISDSTAEIFKTNILQIKTFCSCFFQPFKQLASLNYKFLFDQIEKSIDFAINSPQVSIKFNLFMFLCEVMDRNYLQRNIVMIKCNDEELFILSRCINKTLKFLQTYMKNKQQVVLNEQIILMDISILIFFDKILSQFLGYFENHESTIEIKQKIFLNILKIENKSAFNANQSEEFILFCVQSVLSFLLIYNKNLDSNHINDFIFQTINRILMKFKWGIKRDVFKNSHIYARLEQFFTQVEKETNIKPVVEVQGVGINLGLFHQFYKLNWRKKLLKVIALLYFDDIIDDYRRNLEGIFTSLRNEHILTILLDIQGIGQAIDTISIYKTFLEMIEKYFNMDVLTRQLVQFASSFNGFDKISQKYPRVKIIKQIVKMHKAILSNKGQRIGNPKNMQAVYLMIKDLIKYWIEFLRMSNTEEWVSVIRVVMNIITELIKCDKINFYLVQRVCGQDYVEFFNELFIKMVQMSQKIEQNPKFYQAYLNTMTQMSRQILELIFFPSVKIKLPSLSQKNKQISQTFLQLFLSIFKKIPQFLEEVKVGNVKNEVYLEKSLQITKFTLCFIDFKKRQNLVHKQEMTQIKQFIEEMKQLIFQYSNQILSYLSTEKHFSVHRRTLIILLYEGTIIYPELMDVLIGGMSLPNYLFTEVKQCLDCIKKEQQELFIDKFKTWLRMIHMSEEEVKNNKQMHRDFYGLMGII